MAVTLPVLADASVDERRAVAQSHPCSALVRLLVILNVVLLGGKSNKRTPSFDPHPPDIPTLQLLGMLEKGRATLAPRLPVHNLAIAIVRPPGGVQGRHAKSLRANIEFEPTLAPKQIEAQNAEGFGRCQQCPS